MGRVHQLRPLPPEPPLEVNGIGRIIDKERLALCGGHVLEVYFTRRPTDDEMRAFNEWVRSFDAERRT